ncbi:unnamed protein product [Thlaspi arvense]|uniref:UBX domain-containing protein n=1 Tax=Thlaspi arvense TaxID=13288 RepID=A0AAU9T4T4_THLAR|nr:unnamed protein product [Thlaspi arvense]
METETRSDDQQKLVSSSMEIHNDVGQTMKTAIPLRKTTTRNLEEVTNHICDNQPLFTQNSSGTLVGVIWDSKPESSHDLASVKSDSRYSSLYRPPLKLLFQGSFKDAKSTSSRKNLWLLVNLQSATEFASPSHMRNLDLWLNEAVSQVIESGFILWQVYDDTNEGKEISTFYKIESAPPVVLLIDPFTGQEMRSWSGEIETNSFVEGLLRFKEAGPNEQIASLTRNIRQETKEEHNSSSRNNTDQVPAHSEEFEKEGTCSSRNSTDQVLAPSCGEEFEKEETCSSSNNVDHIVAPELEETAGVKVEEEDLSDACSLSVRFPDGRIKEKRFLKSEPIQYLWYFCCSHMEESEKRAFNLVQVVHGASRFLDFGDDATFEQYGLDNSMISVTWE